jgi:hypothetical protein
VAKGLAQRLDEGLAQGLAQDVAEERATRPVGCATDRIIGTKGFQDPACVQMYWASVPHRSFATEAWDVYSLGVIMFSMITGLSTLVLDPNACQDPGAFTAPLRKGERALDRLRTFLQSVADHWAGEVETREKEAEMRETDAADAVDVYEGAVTAAAESAVVAHWEQKAVKAREVAKEARDKAVRVGHLKTMFTPPPLRAYPSRDCDAAGAELLYRMLQEKTENRIEMHGRGGALAHPYFRGETGGSALSGTISDAKFTELALQARAANAAQHGK